MIHVVKIGARGDLLLATPAFRHLRQSRTGRRIVLVVGASCRDVAEHLPFFDEIRVVDDHALFGPTLRGRIRGAIQIFRILREQPTCVGEGSEEAILLHRDWRFAVLAWLAGVPIRRGFAPGPGTRFLTHAHAPRQNEHHTAQYLGVVGGNSNSPANLAGGWRFHGDERRKGLDAAKVYGFDPRRAQWVALGFGGGRNSKMTVDVKAWPIEYYRRLATRLEAEAGVCVVWLGDDHDARRLGEGYVGLNLAGKLSVTQTAAVLESCALAVANDTMLLHLAGALGVPALGVFGPTDPSHYRPAQPHSGYAWIGREALPCAPCHRDGYYPPCLNAHRCMRDLRVETVLGKAMTLLAARERAPAPALRREQG